MRNNAAIALIIFVTGLLLYLLFEGTSGYDYSQGYGVYGYSRGDDSGDMESSDTVIHSVTNYSSRDIIIPAGTSCENAGKATFPEMANLSLRYNIGCAKLITEMSVDKTPSLPPTSTFKDDTKLTILQPEILQICEIYKHNV